MLLPFNFSSSSMLLPFSFSSSSSMLLPFNFSSASEGPEHTAELIRAFDGFNKLDFINSGKSEFIVFDSTCKVSINSRTLHFTFSTLS